MGAMLPAAGRAREKDWRCGKRHRATRRGEGNDEREPRVSKDLAGDQVELSHVNCKREAVPTECYDLNQKAYGSYKP